MVAYGFKRRFINPVRVGLGLPPIVEFNGHQLVDDMEAPIHPKRQTIRAFGKRHHAKADQEVQLYTAMRTKYCWLVGRGRCTGFEGVLLKWSTWSSFATFDVVEREPGVWRRHGDLRPIKDIEAFARDDGFASFDDMRTFWAAEHGGSTFEGAIIRWVAPA